MALVGTVRIDYDSDGSLRATARIAFSVPRGSDEDALCEQRFLERSVHEMRLRAAGKPLATNRPGSNGHDFHGTGKIVSRVVRDERVLYVFLGKPTDTGPAPDRRAASAQSN